MSENNSILIRGNRVSPMATSKNTTGRVKPGGASGGFDIIENEWLLYERANLVCVVEKIVFNVLCQFQRLL